METFILAIAVVAVMMAFLGLGLLFKRQCLRGACSHAAKPIVGRDGESLMCPRCEREISERHKPDTGTEED